jgi:hypothetical protein
MISNGIPATKVFRRPRSFGIDRDANDTRLTRRRAFRRRAPKARSRSGRTHKATDGREDDWRCACHFLSAHRPRRTAWSCNELGQPIPNGHLDVVCSMVPSLERVSRLGVSSFNSRSPEQMDDAPLATRQPMVRFRRSSRRARAFIDRPPWSLCDPIRTCAATRSGGGRGGGACRLTPPAGQEFVGAANWVIGETALMPNRETASFTLQHRSNQ